MTYIFFKLNTVNNIDMQMQIIVVLFVLYLFYGINNAAGTQKELNHALIEANMAMNTSCSFAELESSIDGFVETCAYRNSDVVQSMSMCDVTHKERLLTVQCVDGFWKLHSGTDDELIPRRNRRGLLGDVFDFFKDAIRELVTVIYCVVIDDQKICREEDVKTENVKPPTFTVCPPSDIQTEYIAPGKERTIPVTWSDPVATDDDNIISNDQTCCQYKKGDRFPGLPHDGREHTITYTAIDSHSLKETCSFSFIVKYLTCEEPVSPQNGQKVSCTASHLYGSECTFTCNSGYELVGGTTSTCEQTETWTQIPTCEKVTCSTPFSIDNGNVECDSSSYLYDEDCLFTCNDGYGLQGPLKMTCQADRTWSVNEANVRCIDDEPPVISCVSPQVFYADRGHLSTTVIWEEPTATDNVDPDANIDIQKVSGPDLGEVLEEGVQYFVNYTATDTRGNTHEALSECTITLEVQVIKCASGPADALDNSRFLMYNCSDDTFYNGVECMLGCDLNLPLNGSDLMTCERDGVTDKGIWSWGSGEQPVCHVVECPILDPPAHGSMTYDTINARPIRVMLCQNTYDISTVGSVFVGQLSCQDSGTWYPLDAFPDCIKSILPWLNLPAELYYEGDCNDNSTKEIIKEKMLTYLGQLQDDIYNSICPDTSTCTVDNLNVECGVTRKRRSVDIVPLVVNGQSHSLTKRQTGYSLVSWDFRIVFDTGNKTDQDAYVEFLSVFEAIKSKTVLDVSNGELNISGFATPDFQTAAYPSLECADGYIQVQTTCKPCPPGTFLNQTSGLCDYCPVGEYMDHEGATVCDTCATGYSTLSTGSKSINKCLKLCTAGYISSTSMEPCSACPRGQYQSASGQAVCHICPSDTTTPQSNSTSAADCVQFDLKVTQLSSTTEVGSFITSNTTVISLSVWFKKPINSIPDLSINVGDAAGSVFVLQASDPMSLNVGNSTVSLGPNHQGCVYGYGSDNQHQASAKTCDTVDISSSESVSIPANVTSSRWTHTVVSLDLAEASVQVVVDGSQVVDQNGLSVDSTRVVDDGHVKFQSSSENVLFLSGFALYNRQLSVQEMSSFSQVCQSDSGDEIFTMDSFLDNIQTGITTIAPTTCDPYDDCLDDPCGKHICVNEAGGFTCVCHGGWTGDVCDIPPDYCEGNLCQHGQCVPGNGTYSCSCNDYYTGPLCDRPPVNGVFSRWGLWSECSSTCNGGSSTRERVCDSPAPGPGGLDCVGPSSETRSCNTHACPECAQLKREFGASLQCTTDSGGMKECTVSCINGKSLPTGQYTYNKYTCGPMTGYKWQPTDRLPTCGDINPPLNFGLVTSAKYTNTFPNAKVAAVQNQVESNLGTLSCVKNATCQMTATVTNESSRKRSTTTSTILVGFTFNLSDITDLDLFDYINGSTSDEYDKLVNVILDITEAIGYVQNHTTEIFTVDVDGVIYNVDDTTLDVYASVQCPSGFAGTDGMCVECPVGTYEIDSQCKSCELGTYQPNTGQGNCESCPTGYTTSTFAASSLAECSVPVDVDDSDYSDESDEKSKKDDEKKDEKLNGGVIIAIAVSCAAFVIALIAAGLVMCKKFCKHRKRNSPTGGSFLSLGMVRPVSRPIVVESCRTRFDNTKQSWPNLPGYGTPDVPPPSYDTHDFSFTSTLPGKKW